MTHPSRTRTYIHFDLEAMPETEFSDDYLAELLAKDARDVSLRYSAVGMDAYPQAKLPASKPRPNTRFLRAIIKETDSHNTALLAKEATVSKARLQKLQTKEIPSGSDIRKRQLGLITAHISNPKRPESDNSGPHEGQIPKRVDSSDHREPLRRNHEPERVENQRGSRRTEHVRRDAESRRSVSLDDTGERHIPRSQGRRHRSRSPLEPVEDRPKKYRSRHQYEVSESSSRKPSDREDESLQSENPYRHSKSTRRGGEHVVSTSRRKSHKIDRQEREDSDPLDDIIGPQPPAVNKIQSRGRGQISVGSGIDSRFSSDYDPTSDVQLNIEEADDWDQALEALRDRQKWHKNSADRLRAAGFTQEDIERWERGGEKREEDVRWTKQGEDREWDRGKVVEVDGVDVVVRKRTPDVDMSFGRLKDC